MELNYNCHAPVAILAEGRIRCSRINGRSRGVSLSACATQWAHGPFKLVFKPDREWYRLLGRVAYGVPVVGGVDPLHKLPCFAGEEEWWSSVDVVFALEDLARIVVLANGPGARLFPRKWRHELREVRRRFPGVLLVVDETRYPTDG